MDGILLLRRTFRGRPGFNRPPRRRIMSATVP